MEIHKPKPSHNWREFLTEIGTIVIGILIALSLEQTVEALHERHLAHEANDAINAEIRVDLGRIATHLAMQTCNERRLDEIADLLRDWKSGKEPPAGLTIGDPGDEPLVDQRWQANLNNGRFSQQSPAEQAQQAAFYTQISILNVILDREHGSWSQLRALELGPGVLSTDMRPGLVAALASAQTNARDLRLLSQYVLKNAESTFGATKATLNPDVLGGSCRPMRAATG